MQLSDNNALKKVVQWLISKYGEVEVLYSCTNHYIRSSKHIPVRLSHSPLKMVKSGDVLIGPTGGSLRLPCLTSIEDTNFLVPCLINKLSSMLVANTAPP